ncbi:MAG: hypothetical protein M3440_10410 [Chloroflexota bacterium]|nr:hypothetical protein [Chloroflexota bacterium]
MLEWIYERRTFLEDKRDELVMEASVPHEEVDGIDYKREDPSFEFWDEIREYQHLCGRIKECTYMIAAIMTPPADDSWGKLAPPETLYCCSPPGENGCSIRDMID